MKAFVTDKGDPTVLDMLFVPSWAFIVLIAFSAVGTPLIENSKIWDSFWLSFTATILSIFIPFGVFSLLHFRIHKKVKEEVKKYRNLFFGVPLLLFIPALKGTHVLLEKVIPIRFGEFVFSAYFLIWITVYCLIFSGFYLLTVRHLQKKKFSDNKAVERNAEPLRSQHPSH